MPITRKRRSQKSAIAKEKILNAARNLSIKNGFTALTVKQVCEASGVSVGSFYNCFEGISEMIKEADDSVDRLFPVQSPDDLDGETSIEKLISFAHRYAQLNVSTGVEDLSVLMTPGHGNAQFSRHKPMADVIEAVISDGQDKGELTKDYTVEQMREIIFVTLRGCAYDWCMSGGGYDLEEKTVRHTKLLMVAMQRIA